MARLNSSQKLSNLNLSMLPTQLLQVNKECFHTSWQRRVKAVIATTEDAEASLIQIIELRYQVAVLCRAFGWKLLTSDRQDRQIREKYDHHHAFIWSTYCHVIFLCSVLKFYFGLPKSCTAFLVLYLSTGYSFHFHVGYLWRMTLSPLSRSSQGSNLLHKLQEAGSTCCHPYPSGSID